MKNDLNISNFEPYAQNIEIVKDFFKNWKTLLTGILSFLIAILNIAIAYLTYIFTNNYAINILSSSEFMKGHDISNFQPIINSSQIITSVISFVPSIVIFILVAFSFIYIYIKSKSQNISNNPLLGVSILKVIYIIELIFSIICVLLVIICFALLGIAFPIASDDISSISNLKIDYSTFSTFYLISAIIIIVFALFTILFYSSKVKYISGIKESLTSPNLTCKGASTLSVMYIILIVINAISVLVSIFEVFAYSFFGKPDIQRLNTSVSTLKIISIFTLVLLIVSLVNNIMLKSLSTGWKNKVINVKTAHLKDYNDGYDYTSKLPYQYDFNNTNNKINELTNNTINNQATPIEKPTQQVIQPTCPECNAPVLLEDSFCTNCGTNLKS